MATVTRSGCSDHGGTVDHSNVVGARCWVCDGVRPACPHPGATFTLSARGQRPFVQPDWRAEPCPACAAERAAAAQAKAAAAAQAAADREARIVATAAARGEKLISARRASQCYACGAAIRTGDRIAWSPGARDARHATCGLDATTVAPARAADAGALCAVCGVEGLPLVGSSVRGRVCLDCYDRVEAEA